MHEFGNVNIVCQTALGMDSVRWRESESIWSSPEPPTAIRALDIFYSFVLNVFKLFIVEKGHFKQDGSLPREFRNGETKFSLL